MSRGHRRRIDTAELADLLAHHAARHGVPGAALGVLCDDELETACYGVADVRTLRPVTPTTPFTLGSLTKPLVATVLAQLAAADELSLNDSLAARVPETSGFAWAEQATLRDLMANRSTVPLTLDLEFGFDRRQDAGDGALAGFAAEIAAHDPSPGNWSYTNAGWCLLGRAVEAVTGATFEDAARRHLASAGVDGIAFTTDTSVADRVTGHDLTNGEPVPVPPLVNRAYAPAGTSATGGIEALLGFARWHLIAPDLGSLRETTQHTSMPGWFDGWCLGWGRFDWSHGPAWGWDGMINGERNLLRLLPDRRSAVVLLANASSGRALARTLMPEVVASAFDIQVPVMRLDPVAGATGDLTRFAGTYAWPDRRIDVAVTAEGLRITEGDRVDTARALDGRSFLLDREDADGPIVTFGDFDEDGSPGVLYDYVWGVPRVDRQVPNRFSTPRRGSIHFPP